MRVRRRAAFGHSELVRVASAETLNCESYTTPKPFALYTPEDYWQASLQEKPQLFDGVVWCLVSYKARLRVLRAEKTGLGFSTGEEQPRV